MKKSILLALALAIVAPMAPAQSVKWAKSFGAAKKQARAEGKLLMVDFFATWCGPCKQLESITFKDPNVVRSLSRFVMVKLDTDREGAPVGARFGVQALPTVIVMQPDESVVGRINGFLPPREFLAELSAIESGFSEHQKTLRALKANPNQGALHARAATFYAQSQQIPRALTHLQQIRTLNYRGRDQVPALLEAGRFQIRSQNPTSAIVHLERARSLGTAKDQLMANAMLMVAYRDAKQIPKARAAAQRVLRDKDAPERLKEVAKAFAELR